MAHSSDYVDPFDFARLERENAALRDQVQRLESELEDWRTATGRDTHPEVFDLLGRLRSRIADLSREVIEATAKSGPSNGGEFGVPWEPTENMLNAGMEAGMRALSEAAAEIQIKDARPGITRAVWQGMLAATGKAYIPPPARVRGQDTRSCTCHPIDNPPRPCPRKFSLNDCRAAAALSEPQPGGTT